MCDNFSHEILRLLQGFPGPPRLIAEIFPLYPNHAWKISFNRYYHILSLENQNIYIYIRYISDINPYRNPTKTPCKPPWNPKDFTQDQPGRLWDARVMGRLRDPCGAGVGLPDFRWTKSTKKWWNLGVRIWIPFNKFNETKNSEKLRVKKGFKYHVFICFPVTLNKIYLALRS